MRCYFIKGQIRVGISQELLSERVGDGIKIEDVKSDGGVIYRCDLAIEVQGAQRVVLQQEKERNDRMLVFWLVPCINEAPKVQDAFTVTQGQILKSGTYETSREYGDQTVWILASIQSTGAVQLNNKNGAKITFKQDEFGEVRLKVVVPPTELIHL